MSGAGGNGPEGDATFGARIEAVVEGCAGRLFELLEEVRLAASHMGVVADMAGAAGRQRLGARQAAAEGFIDRARARFGQLGAAAERLSAQAARLSILLDEQDRDLRLAGMIGLNARVVSSTVPGDDGTLAGFAEEVRGLLAQADRSLARLRDGIGTADAALEQVRPGLQELSREVGRLRSLRAELPAAISGLAAEASLAAMAQEARRGLGELGAGLEAAVSHLQVGDAVRQRLEHAARIEAMRPRAAGDEAVLGALAMAQRRAALDRLRDAIDASGPELSRIGGPWAQVQRDMGRIARSPTAAGLTRIGDLLSGFTSGLAQLEDRTAELGAAMALVAERYADARRTAQDFAALERQITLLGNNSVLASSRCGQDGMAMSEVSRQLRTRTLEIARRTRQLVDLATEQEAEAAQVRDIAPADLAEPEEVGALSEELGRLRDALEGLGAAAGPEHPTNPVAELRVRLSRLAEEAAARAPPGGSPQPVQGVPGRALTALLAEARSLYTMAEERMLHDELFPSLRPAGPEEGPMDARNNPGGEELDDVFFG